MTYYIIKIFELEYPAVMLKILKLKFGSIDAAMMWTEDHITGTQGYLLEEV